MNYEINWEHIWEISTQFFTDGQIKEFQEMINEWKQPPKERFTN